MSIDLAPIRARDAETTGEAAQHPELSWVRAAEDRHALLAEVDELRAALENERGAGAGPSEGWSFFDLSWTKGSADAGPWLWVGVADKITDGWEWTITLPCSCPEHRDGHESPKRTAPTARQAMRDADEALAAWVASR